MTETATPGPNDEKTDMERQRNRDRRTGRQTNRNIDTDRKKRWKDRGEELKQGK